MSCVSEARSPERARIDSQALTFRSAANTTERTEGPSRKIQAKGDLGECSVTEAANGCDGPHYNLSARTVPWPNEPGEPRVVLV